MRVLVLTRYDRLGSSSRVRFYQYFPYLESEGVEIQKCFLLSDDYVRGIYDNKNVDKINIIKAYSRRISYLLRNRTFDLLWIEKEILPWLPAWIEHWLTTKIPCVVDYDDAVFHRYANSSSRFIRTFLHHKIDKVMGYSSLVVAGNEYIAERARQAGAKRVEILPSVVDVEQYPIKQVRPGLTIGWIGSPVTAPFLKSIQPALKRSVENTGVELTLIGAGNSDPLPDIKKTSLLWSETTEISHLQSFDVGIMPLPDEPFERGKCGYKLIQYMASGLPVIASPVGVNQSIVEHGVNGYLATTNDEWFAAISQLIHDPEKRQELGLSGRKRAEKSYNLRHTAPQLFSLLRSLLE